MHSDACPPVISTCGLGEDKFAKAWQTQVQVPTVIRTMESCHSTKVPAMWFKCSYHQNWSPFEVIHLFRFSQTQGAPFILF